MDIYEYKKMCEDRVEALKRDLLKEEARVLAIEEIILLGVYIPVEENKESEEENSCSAIINVVEDTY